MFSSSCVHLSYVTCILMSPQSSSPSLISVVVGSYPRNKPLSCGASPLQGVWLNHVESPGELHPMPRPKLRHVWRTWRAPGSNASSARVSRSPTPAARGAQQWGLSRLEAWKQRWVTTCHAGARNCQKLLRIMIQLCSNPQIESNRYPKICPSGW